jgi:hypothetical protein
MLQSIFIALHTPGIFMTVVLDDGRTLNRRIEQPSAVSKSR